MKGSGPHPQHDGCPQHDAAEQATLVCGGKLVQRLQAGQGSKSGIANMNKEQIVTLAHYRGRQGIAQGCWTWLTSYPRSWILSVLTTKICNEQNSNQTRQKGWLPHGLFALTTL